MILLINPLGENVSPIGNPGIIGINSNNPNDVRKFILPRTLRQDLLCP